MSLGSSLRQLRYRLGAAWLRQRGFALGEGARLEPSTSLRLGYVGNRRGRIVAGAKLRCEVGVVLNAHGGEIVLGSRVYVGPGTAIYGHGGVTIGDDCLIAMHCSILSSNHTIAPFGTPINAQPDVLRPTRIGADVWLGAGVVVLGGVTIGDGCIVGAGSVVTKDLPAGAVAFGQPATVRSWRDGAPR